MTSIENFMKFERVVFEIWERTDRQTGIQTHSSQYFDPYTADDIIIVENLTCQTWHLLAALTRVMQLYQTVLKKNNLIVEIW